jgi:hypothetical protein
MSFFAKLSGRRFTNRLKLCKRISILGLSITTLNVHIVGIETWVKDPLKPSIFTFNMQDMKVGWTLHGIREYISLGVIVLMMTPPVDCN